MKKLIIILLIGFSTNLFAQTFFNLDFEYKINENMPKAWYCQGKGYTTQLDSKKKTSGKNSLRIECEKKEEMNAFAVATSMFPVELVKGKHIVFKGSIKTKALKNGYAGLWWRVDGPNKKMLGFDNMANRGITGNTNWTEAKIEMDIDSNAIQIVFGAIHSGEGTAWFDNFEIWIDGNKYIEQKPRNSPPTKEELAWLKKHIHPLKTYNANETDNSDLKVIDDIAGNAKILALGEVTHGSKEIFIMKHRIIKYMAENKGFDIFSIEANMPESYKLNQYTIDGNGNPTDLIEGMYFWTWRTQEVLNMVNWMKDFNTKNQHKIQFTGFDMQSFEGPINELKDLFKDDSIAISNLHEELLVIKKSAQANYGMPSATAYQQKKINTLLDSIKEKIQVQITNDYTKKWAIQNIRIIEQYLDKNYKSRDKYMAENLLWIKNHNPDSKIVAWAHNAHIQKTGYAMGKYLSEELKDDYLSIGFAFHEGNYTAVGNNGLSSYDAQNSYIGTYEYFFNSIKEPIFLLDLRQAKKENNEAAKWLLNELEFRQVGAMKIDQEFRNTNLTHDFDYIIFIDKSTHSELLK